MCDFIKQQWDYSVVFSLGEETGELMAQSPYQDGDPLTLKLESSSEFVIQIDEIWSLPVAMTKAVTFVPYLSTGKNCEMNINECESNPCVHGKCIDMIDKFICHCDVPYTGDRCDIRIDPCSSNPCQNSAQCAPQSNYPTRFKCHCLVGFTGRSFICLSFFLTNTVVKLSVTAWWRWYWRVDPSSCGLACSMRFWVSSND